MNAARYLATRRKEYNNLRGTEWECLMKPVPGSASKRSIAEAVADRLSRPQGGEGQAGAGVGQWTLLHGDVKSENLFTTADGAQAAFFDFQYVGVGLGACDLAKLLTCSISERMLGWDDDPRAASGGSGIGMCAGEERLLRYYLSQLPAAVAAGATTRYEWETFVRHWEWALVDWLRFQAGWGFWGATAWLEARVRHIVAQPAFLQSIS